MPAARGELLWSSSSAPEETVGSAHYRVEQGVFPPKADGSASAETQKSGGEKESWMFVEVIVVNWRPNCVDYVILDAWIFKLRWGVDRRTFQECFKFLSSRHGWPWVQLWVGVFCVFSWRGMEGAPSHTYVLPFSLLNPGRFPLSLPSRGYVVQQGTSATASIRVPTSHLAPSPQIFPDPCCIKLSLRVSWDDQRL